MVITFGFGHTHRHSWDSAPLFDSTYDEPGKSEGAFIDFSELSGNLSVQTARAFQTVIPKGMVISPREEMFLYLRFLETQAKLSA